MNRNLSDNELSRVCEWIAVHTGLHFPVERWVMLGRNLALAAGEFGFQSMNAFIQWLLSSELNKDQVKILASHLTISETYFLREPHVFTALTDHVLPGIIKLKKRINKSIRIWSAGCSTGEEPYSLAIMLHKTIPEIKDWNITILATDINLKALDKAVTGIYGPWSFRNTPEWFRTRYFLDLGDRRYEIIPEIRNMVTFSCQSLTDDDIFSSITDKMDIIFCRNVLMYFTGEWVNKISRNLYNCLSEDGWFVLSSSELSSQVFPQFTPINFPGAVLYRKSKNGSAYLFPSTALTEKEAPLFLTFQPPSTPFNLSSTEAFFDRRNEVKVDLTPSSTLPFTPSPVQPFNSSTFQPPSTSSTIQQPQSSPDESYTSIIRTIRLLADQGFLSEALSLCNKTIATDKLAPGLYFMRASILQEMDKSSEAINSLKKAIYIDPDYAMGHFVLGSLYNSQGIGKYAKRHFINVLNLLNKCSNDDILPESEGLSVKYIREIIFANMQTLGTK
jgi:chemotaxis protein methyltransferase CheR